jgi:hypothetical protein
MTERVSKAWQLMARVGACTAMMLAAACSGSDSPRTETDTQSPTQTRAAARMAEKPFASGGKIEMQLAAGGYVVRPASGNMIRISFSGNVGSATADISTAETRANVTVKDTPRNNFQATIEVPRNADLVIRLTAGELKVEAISGNKDIESNAGNVDVITGEAKDYASVDASVQAGDINAEAFGESRSGIFPKLTWSGQGKYTLRAKLIAGNLTLRRQ